MAVDTARTLVATYLGRDAAERVLRGEIERGRVNTVPTVLWFSDLTNFTRTDDTLPREQFLDLLNIGPAVNEVARIQAMSRSIDQPILVSASFAAACGDQRECLVCRGRYALGDVGRP